MDQGDSAGEQAAGLTATRRLRVLEWGLAIAAVVLAVPFLARLLSIEAGPLAYLVAFTPWFTLAWLLLAVVAAGLRIWRIAAVIAIPALVSAAWALPLFLPSGASAEGDTLTVATVNATFGRVDAEEVVALVDEHDVDILAVEELTPEIADALTAAGLDQMLPFSESAPESGVTGTGLWSRSELISAESLPGFTADASAAAYVSRAVTGAIDVGGTEVSVLAVHPAAPGPFDHANWDSSMSALADYLAAQDQPTLVLGDFNTTRDHASFRAIESLGYVDAADDAGVGILFTFPEGRLPFPVVAIDHVLTRGLDWAATSVEAVPLTGADHRALVVTYVLD